MEIAFVEVVTYTFLGIVFVVLVVLVLEKGLK